MSLEANIEVCEMKQGGTLGTLAKNVKRAVVFSPSSYILSKPNKFALELQNAELRWYASVVDNKNREKGERVLLRSSKDLKDSLNYAHVKDKGIEGFYNIYAVIFSEGSVVKISKGRELSDYITVKI